MNLIPRQSRSRLGPRRAVRAFATSALAGLLMLSLAGTAAIGPSRSVARAQAAAPETATVVPESALMFFAVNLDTGSAQYQQATELLQRIGLDASIEDIAEEMGASTTGQDLDDAPGMDAFLGGEVGIAVFSLGSDLADLGGMLGTGTGSFDPETGSGDAATETSAAFIISAPDPAAAFAAAETEMQQTATDGGATVTVETYEGVEISSIPGDEFSGETGSSLALVGDFVVAGATADDVKPVIDTEAGRVPAISAADGFTTVSAELNAEWIVFGFVNGAELADQLGAMSGAAGVSVDSIELAQVQADTAFVLWADDPGFRIDSITSAGAGGTVTQASNFDAELPGRVPGDTFIFTDAYDLGGSGILDALFLGILAGVSGSFEPIEATPAPVPSAEEQFAQLEQLLGFNVKTDFIDQLVGEWGLAMWGLTLDDNGEFSADDFGFLLVSDAQTPATLADAVSKLSLLLQAGFAGQANVTTRVIGEDQISVITIDPGDGTPPMTVEYGVVDGQFVISLNDAVTGYLDGFASPLSENPNYQAAMAALPAEHNAILYLDLTQIVAIAEAAIASASAGFEFEDASEKCAEYSTQAAAQEAFDADPALNWELDQDFDGEACEDFFAADEPEPTPDDTASEFGALKAFVTVGFERDGLAGTSSLLLIQE